MKISPILLLLLTASAPSFAAAVILEAKIQINEAKPKAFEMTLKDDKAWETQEEGNLLFSINAAAETDTKEILITTKISKLGDEKKTPIAQIEVKTQLNRTAQVVQSVEGNTTVHLTYTPSEVR